MAILTSKTWAAVYEAPVAKIWEIDEGAATLRTPSPLAVFCADPSLSENSDKRVECSENKKWQ